MAKEPKLWACADPEELCHATPDQAIEAYLGQWSAADLLRDRQIEVVGYAPMEVGEAMKEHLRDVAVAAVLEALDGELGNPYGDDTEPTVEMLEAAKPLVDAVAARYRVWSCAAVETRRVNVLQWVREHHPEWLEDPAR